MDVHDLAREIHRSQQRVTRLRETPADSTARLMSVLSSTVRELDLAHEELQVCNEELQSQAEELARRRDDPGDALLRAYCDSPAPFLTLNRYGAVRKANRAAALAMGTTPARMEGFPFAQYLRQADRRAFRSRLSTTLRTTEAVALETAIESGERPRAVTLTLWRLDVPGRNEHQVAVVVAASPEPPATAVRMPGVPRTPIDTTTPELRELARQLAIGFADVVVIHLEEPSGPHLIAAVADADLPGPAGVRIDQRSLAQRPVPLLDPGVRGPTRVSVDDDLRLRETLGRLYREPLTGGSLLTVQVNEGAERGSVTLVRRRGRAAFGPSDLDRALRTADYLALLGGEARREHQRLDTARRLRSVLLPHSLPVIPGAELSAAYHPAVGDGGFGGDFYAAIAGPHGWHLAVGDACGKDGEAAAMTSILRNGLHVLCAEFDDPGTVLDRLNRVVLNDEACERFATVVLAGIRPGPDGLEVTMATSGHTRGMRVDTAGKVSLCLGGGLPTGLFDDSEAEVERFLLAPGDLLLLYTDGLTEARDASGRMLGEEGLMAMLEGLPPVSAGETVRLVERRLEALRGLWTEDDVVLLAVRATPPV